MPCHAMPCLGKGNECRHAMNSPSRLRTGYITSTMRFTARTQMPRSAPPRMGTCARNAGAPAQSHVMLSG